MASTESAISTNSTVDTTRRVAMIVVALPVEFAAVVAHLSSRKEIVEQGTIYEEGEFSGRTGAWTVVVVEVGKGNTTAAVETERGLRLFHPHVTLMLGVAGGIKDVRLGDVVASEKVYYYEPAKDTDLGAKARPDFGQPSHTLVQRARAVARRNEWQARIMGNASNESPSALIAPIAAGERVVAGTLSAAFQDLRSTFNDAVAVEMEGFGVLRAAHMNEARGLVVRGISDLIDGKGAADATGSQDRASRHAAAFGFQCLSDLPVEEGHGGRVWNVPQQRNRRFTGRRNELEELDKALQSFEGDVRLHALVGLTGSGKSALATECAFRFKDRFDVIWWVRASQRAVMALDYVAVGVAGLGFQFSPETPLPQAVRDVRQALEFKRNWLLIFDDIYSPDWIAEYLPRLSRNGHVLVTSQNPNWLQLGNVIPVGMLPSDVSTSFLISRSGSRIDSGAKEVADELGGLPLALEQAAGYVEATGITFVAYLKLLREKTLELLATAPPGTSNTQTVAAALDLSLERMERESKTGIYLLEVCSHVAPDAIPRLLLLAGDENNLEWQSDLAALMRFSLMECKGDWCYVHRLVQSIVRERMSRARAVDIVSVLLVSLTAPVSAKPIVPHEAWSYYEALLPHIFAASSYAEFYCNDRKEIDNKQLTRLAAVAARALRQVSYYLHTRGDYESALAVSTKDLEFLTLAFGSTDHRVAVQRGFRAEILMSAKRLVACTD